MRRGFTLVEALVSVALLSLAVVGSLTALSQMTKSEAALRERVQLERLSQRKLDEAIATSEIPNAPLDGTFEDQGHPEISYQIETEPSTVENLLIVRSSAFFTRQGEDSGVTTTTLLYEAPAATGAARP